MDKTVKLITDLNEAQSKMIIEHISLSSQAIKAEVKAANDMLEIKVDGVIKRQDVANGRTDKLEKKTLWIDFIRKNKIISAIFILALVYGMSVLAGKVDFKQTIENQTGIEFKTDTIN